MALALGSNGPCGHPAAQPDRAIKYFDQAIRLNPNYADAYTIRGIAKQAKGDSAGGDADIAKAKQLNPSKSN